MMNKRQKIMKLFSTCMSHISQDFFYTLFNSIFTNREAKYFLDHTHYKPFMFHDIQLSSDGEVLPIFIKLSLWAHYLLLTFQLVLPATSAKYDLHLYLFLLTRNVTSELCLCYFDIPSLFSNNIQKFKTGKYFYREQSFFKPEKYQT